MIERVVYQMAQPECDGERGSNARPRISQVVCAEFVSGLAQQYLDVPYSVHKIRKDCSSSPFSQASSSRSSIWMIVIVVIEAALASLSLMTCTTPDGPTPDQPLSLE
jgi:hypothetical protein